MKTSTILALGLLLAAPAARAQTIFLSHHGRLLLPDDTPVDGQREITVSLFATETAQTSVWSETYTVSVFKGVYAILLGDTHNSKAALEADDVAGERWLGIKVGTDELTPRLRLGTVPSAVHADSADSAASAGVADALAPTATVGGSQVTGKVAAATDADSADLALDLDCAGCITRDHMANDGCDDGDAFVWSISANAWTCQPVQPAATGPLSIAEGGTGATTASAGLAALLPAQTGKAGAVLSTDGTAAAWEAPGSGANKLIRLDSAGKLPALDGSQLINLPIPTGLQGYPVSSTQPTTGDLLTWTGTQWVPTKPVSFGTGCEPGSYVTGLNADGTLQCYVAKGFQKVTAGLYFSCGLVSDGSVRCWGYGSNSSLGNKSTLNQFKPVAVKTATGVLANAIDISSGYYHSCAVVGATPTDTQGQVWCWGLGTNGQLGDGTVVTKAYAVQVTGITTATQVSAGYLHSCARLANGTAQCWGNNAESRLGNGGTTQSAVPVTVVASGTAGISDISQISAGGRHTCAVRATGGGTAWCWGYNGYGQLGDNTTTNRQYPTQVNTITTGVTKVSAGFHFHYDGTSSYPTDSSCAIVSGEVWCWGRNNYGQLGDNTSAQKNLPVKVQLETGGFLAGASVIETAGGHTCAVANPTSTTYCWGHNNLRQSATDGTTTDKLRAVVLLDAAGSDPLINSVSIGLSDYYTNTFTLVVTQDPSASTGTAFAMGYNGYGNLGDGTTTNTSGPPIYVTAP